MQLREIIDTALPGVLSFGMKVLFSIVGYFIGIKVIKALRRLLRRFLERANVDAGVCQFLDSMAKVSLYFLLIMLICSWFGLSAASVVALLGSVGLAVGMALQGSLSNFAGGVLILLLKPFKVGDYIIEDTHKNEGTVMEIQLFFTRLATIDNRTVLVPNGTLINASLTNVTDQGKRRVDITVSVSYEENLGKVKAVLTDILLAEPRRLPEEEMRVFVAALQDSGVQMGCRLWVKTEDYWLVRWDLNEAIKIGLDEHGIVIPYPQLTVSFKDV